MTEVRASILKTLAYFDMFDYAIVAEELDKWLYVGFLDRQNFSLDKEKLEIKKLEIEGELDRLVEQGKVGKKNEFYFLPGREEIVEIRKKRYEISLEKIKKARRVAWWLRFIPWIKAIFICSSLGFFNADEKSDIDLLIITSSKGIWSARWWSVGILKILGLRPKNNHHQDKFCLSYFITQDSLNLEKTKIGDNDVHLIYLLAYHLPLYFEDNLWQRFINSNDWIKKYLPNLCELRCELNANKHANDYTNFLIKPRLVWLKRLIRQTQFSWEEKLLKKIQLKIMPIVLKQMMNKDKRVIVNDKMIKLHSNDKRKMYYEKWMEKIRGLFADNH